MSHRRNLAALLLGLVVLCLFQSDAPAVRESDNLAVIPYRQLHARTLRSNRNSRGMRSYRIPTRVFPQFFGG